MVPECGIFVNTHMAGSARCSLNVMAHATPVAYGVQSQASRQRVARAFGFAICSLAVVACVLVAVGQQASSALAQDPSATQPAAASHVVSAPAKPKPVLADKTLIEARNVAEQAKQKWLELKKLEQQPAKHVGLAPSASVRQPPVAHSPPSHKLAHRKNKLVDASYVAEARAIADATKMKWLALKTSESKSSASARSSSGSAGSSQSVRADLSAEASKADDDAADAAEAADAQRALVAREASSYIKAEKRAIVVQEKAARAEARADTARALVADAAARNAAKQAVMFRKRAARASAKAVKYAAQVKAFDAQYSITS